MRRLSLGADRDVLQVRVGAREPARLAAGLHVGRAHPAVGGDRGVERLDDLAQLGRLPMLQEQVEERVGIGLLQVGEHRGIRRVARSWSCGSSAAAARRRAPPAAASASRGSPRGRSRRRPPARWRRRARRGRRRTRRASSCETATPASSMSASASRVGSSMSVSTVATLSGSSARSAAVTRSVNHDSCPGVAPSVSGTSWVGSASGSFSSR